MRALRQRWLLFWFEPALPLNLGVCRALFFGAFFLFYLPQDFAAWGEVSEVFWTPIPLFKAFHLPVPSGDLLAWVEGTWKAALGLGCLGLFTRASTAASFVLGLYLLGLPQNFVGGFLYHYDMLVVLVLGILAFSRCGDAFSADRLIGRARRVDAARPPQASGEYTWPVRAVWLTFALIFFAAGVSKLRHSGLEWIFSENMASILIWAQYRMDPLVSWGLYLAQHEWLYQSMAAATVVLEVGYPLALFSRRARWVIVPAMFCMLVGVRALMGPPFYPFLICHLFWVPWDRLGRRFDGLPRKAARIIVGASR